MKWFMILLIISPGCYYLGKNSTKDIVAHPSSEWSSPEALTVIMGSGSNNLLDNRTNIKAIITPYYPSVVKAIGRRAQAQYHWTEVQFRSYVDNLLRECSGLFIDWENSSEPVYDSKLNIINSPGQFDSLLLLLTLKNTGWPPGKYLLIPSIGPGGQSMINQVIALDDPHYMAPDISNLDSKLFLMNERGELIAPMIVWGRKMNYLTNNEETIFLKFKLSQEGFHFLDNSGKFYLFIRGIESDIKLELATAIMK